MKGLIQLAVLVIGGYLGYQYYKRNYSVEGKKEQADLLATENYNWQVKADSNKASFISKASAYISQYVNGIPSFGGVRESVRTSLTNAMNKIATETNWFELAKSGQDIPPFKVG